MLSDTKTYIQLRCDPTREILSKLQVIMNKGLALGAIDHILQEYMYVEHSDLSLTP